MRTFLLIALLPPEVAFARSMPRFNVVKMHIDAGSHRSIFSGDTLLQWMRSWVELLLRQKSRQIVAERCGLPDRMGTDDA